MDRTRIYAHTRLSAYLDEAAASLRGEKSASFDKLAKSLGFRSPRGIAMVLAGQRLPSRAMTRGLATLLRLGERERCYLELLVEKARLERQGVATGHLDRELAGLRPILDGDGRDLSDDEFALIGSWYSLALKQLVESPDFREDALWISRRLRRKVTQAQIRVTLDAMLALGLVARGADGRLAVSSGTVQAGGRAAPSAAVRRYHREMLQRTIEALSEQAVEAREFIGLTLALPPGRMAAAKAELKDFVARFAKTYHSDDAAAVYQLNLQLFAHTSD